MKTIVSSLILTITCAYLSSAEEPQHVAPPDKESPSVIVNKSDKVIILSTKEVTDVDMIEKVQEQHFQKLHPGYRVIHNFGIISREGRFIEWVSGIHKGFDLKWTSGINKVNKGFEHTVRVGFDMTDVYRHFRQKDKQSRKAVEKLEKMYIKIAK